MKDFIMYMYNLNDINVFKTKEKIYIKTKNKKYIFYKVYNEQRLRETNNILKNQTEYYKIIKNINNEIITIYNGYQHVLLEVNNEYNIISTKIILKAIDYENMSINHSNWIKLWTIKNDYYDNLNTKNKYINETKDYYIGMAENAIRFIKVNNIKNDQLTICRLKLFDEKLPTDVVLDCKEREIAEIIKYNFFNKNISHQKVIEELEPVINNYEIKKIIARLLYPNYYFDLYDQLLHNEEDTNKIKKVITKNKEYEKLIKEIYNKYGNSNIIMPNWIIKD